MNQKSLKKAEEYWIALAREDSWLGYLAFAYYVFGFMPEDFHIDWIQKFASEERNQLIVAPRGSAKTTYLCIALLKYMSDHPWDANALISVASTQATERLTFIRSSFNNERYQKVYPWIALDSTRPDTQTQFTIWDQRYTYGEWRANIAKLGGDFKSATLRVGGISGRGITGGRITGILAMDDVSDQDNAKTDDLRKQLWHRITDILMPLLLGDHYRVWSISTRWADGDVPSRQMATKRYQYTELKAITRVGEKLKSFWARQFPFPELLSILNHDGKTSFILQRMNNITGLSGAIFTADMLRTDFPRDEQGHPQFPEFDIIYLSTDAAIKAREANDESAIAALGIRTSPNTSLPQMWVLQIRVDHWGNMEVLEQLESMWASVTQNYKAHNYSVLFETTAGHQLFLTLMEQKPDFSIPMRYIETYSPVVDKGTRARSTAAAGERGDLLVDTKAVWYPKWFSQCIEFNGIQGNPDELVDVMTQVGVREFGDINSRTYFSPTVKTIHVPGLSL